MNHELLLLVAGHEQETDQQSEAAAARRQAVLCLLAAGRLCTPAERCAAASVLILGASLAEVEAAHGLALSAIGGEPSARRLAACAYDRLRWLRGEPQKFGTLFVQRDGGLMQWPVDPATTDTERTKWGLPSLSELQRRRGS